MTTLEEYRAASHAATFDEDAGKRKILWKEARRLSMEYGISQGYRISQIVQDGQGWIALIQGNQVVTRFSNWNDAKRAYRAAVAAA